MVGFLQLISKVELKVSRNDHDSCLLQILKCVVRLICTGLCFLLATFLILLGSCVNDTYFLTRQQIKRNMVNEVLNLMSVLLILSDVHVVSIVML